MFLRSVVLTLGRNFVLYETTRHTDSLDHAKGDTLGINFVGGAVSGTGFTDFWLGSSTLSKLLRMEKMRRYTCRTLPNLVTFILCTPSSNHLSLVFFGYYPLSYPY